MIIETLTIAIIFASIALTRRQAGAALGILIISMMLWPEFLRVPLGLLQMSAPRLVAIILLIRFISKGRHRQINFGKADVLVIAIWLWTIFATILADAEFYQVSQMIGRGLDTVLMYFVARMAFINSDDIKSIFWGLGLTAIFMSVAGVYEAVTWSSPYHQFSGGASRIDGYSEIRYGLLRAQASTLGSIYFGMAMMIITGLIWSLRDNIKRKLIFRVIISASVIAALSSMSSGPWIALFTLLIINLYSRKTSLIRPTLFALLFIAIALELASNRHFYNLIDYLALDSQTAWYRARLLEIAVTQWQDYWIIGVGSNWPHHWAALLDGRRYIDVVNNFIIIALYGGLPALIMYISVHVIAIRKAIASFKNNFSTSHRNFLFGLMATLIALDISSMSVGLYGPALLLSHILLGILVSTSSPRKQFQ